MYATPTVQAAVLVALNIKLMYVPGCQISAYEDVAVAPRTIGAVVEEITRDAEEVETTPFQRIGFVVP